MTATHFGLACVCVGDFVVCLCVYLGARMKQTEQFSLLNCRTSAAVLIEQAT